MAEDESETDKGEEAKALKIGDLLDAVVTASGVKRAQAKPVVEATLTALGLLFQDGRALNLPGLGRTHLVRRTEKPNGDVLIVKMKRPGEKSGEKKPKTPLAPGGDES